VPPAVLRKDFSSPPISAMATRRESPHDEVGEGL
jgi:hypothetical protein